MKQVKSLVLAAILVCTLSAGVQAGDMGSPGIKTTTSGDKGSQGSKATTTLENDGLGATTTDTSSSELSPIMLEIWLALLALI
jgi:hypothetical protein